MKFARIKFTRKPDDVVLDTQRGRAVHQVCVECAAWIEINAIKSMAYPDYKELGLGKTMEEAKTDAIRTVMEAHRKFMLGIQ